MQNAQRSPLIILTLCVVLVGAAVGLATLYPRATRSLVRPHQQHLVHRAEQAAATTFHHSLEDQRRITFPIVMELRDRTCVALRPTAADRGGNYLAATHPAGRFWRSGRRSAFERRPMSAFHPLPTFHTAPPRARWAYGVAAFV
jgi:hypothetical protein